MENVEQNHNGGSDFNSNRECENTKSQRACLYIIANQCLLNVAYYGMSTNLVNYLKDHMHEDNVTAANNNTNWIGTGYLTPLFGAFLADAYLGKYWTIIIFMIFCMMGYALLTFSTSIRMLNPCRNGVCDPSVGQSVLFFLALYLVDIGGAMQPCTSSFGGDQFNDSDESDRRLKSSFFNWYYLSINVGALVGCPVLVWVQTNIGWGLGFGLPALAMAFAIIIFLLGSPTYRHQLPGGSPLVRIAQVVVASLRKYKVEVPSDKSLLHEVTDRECAIQGSRKLAYTEKFRYFDKAAVASPEEKIKLPEVSPWRLCTVTQVEELKSILRLLPIWATGIVFSAAYSQMSTMFIIQGDTLNPQLGPHIKIPAASLSAVDTISVIIWVPVYDRMIVPLARRFTGDERGFTQLTRMGIGLFIIIFSMLAAGILEVVRLRTVARYNLYNSSQYLPISIFWQVPQYFIVGASEIFTYIGQLEFFYDQAPDAMRSLCSALSLAGMALGNYLSTLLVTAVTTITARNGDLGWIPDNINSGHLDRFFWLLALLGFVNLLVYVLIARWYTYKQTAV